MKNESAPPRPDLPPRPAPRPAVSLCPSERERRVHGEDVGSSPLRTRGAWILRLSRCARVELPRGWVGREEGGKREPSHGPRLPPMSGKLGVNPHVALSAFIHRPLFNLHQKVSVGHICSLGLTQDTRWALQGRSMLATYRPPPPPPRAAQTLLEAFGSPSCRAAHGQPFRLSESPAGSSA